MSGVFPHAAYFVLSSRLIPDHDGGYTIAATARARQMDERGADVQVLTVDPAERAAHSAHRAEFVRRGMLPAELPLRNLFDEADAPAGGASAWLRTAAREAPVAEPAAEYRVLADDHGRPFLAIPMIKGDPDWLRSRAAVRVYDAAGAVVGTLPGFGALYRAWLSHLADLETRPVVVICESRQLGELLAGWQHPDAYIVHTIHTNHLEPPYTPDAPLNTLWSRWLAAADRFDAVLWPTSAQRDAVVERFGDCARHFVVPNGVDAAEDGVSGCREPGLVMSMSRLAAGKRVDHSIRAFLAADVPGTRLEIWGDGPERDRIATLIDQLGAAPRVSLRGATSDPTAELARASLFVTSTAFEGQGLSIIEALACGVPVVSYDVTFGPRDILARGGGVLVADGDEQGLADAMRMLLTDDSERHKRAVEASTSARAWSAEVAMDALADVMHTVLEAPEKG